MKSFPVTEYHKNMALMLCGYESIGIWTSRMLYT